MPIYEYRCQQCGADFSRLMRMADADVQVECTQCGGEQTSRVLSAFAIGGRADPGPGRAAWPVTWNDTNGADPETLRYWRHRIEREARLEEKYPELADPALRNGQNAPAATPAPAGHDHAHGHHHHHHHHAHDQPATGTPGNEHTG